jgi:hypothetical protein
LGKYATFIKVEEEKNENLVTAPNYSDARTVTGQPL